jgi:hypothetical protein
MKLNQNDLFHKDKFKSYSTILIVTVILIIILRFSLKNYFTKTNTKSYSSKIIKSIIYFDASEIFLLIGKILNNIVKVFSKIFLFEINTYLKDIFMMNDLVNKIGNVINSFNLDFLNKYLDFKQIIENTVLPIFKGMFKIRDIFKKLSGILSTTVHTMMASSLTATALMGALSQIITSMLVLFIPMIIGSFFFNIPFAIMLSVLYVAVAIPMGLVVKETKRIYDLTSTSHNFKSKKIKKLKHCFHRDTIFQTKTGLKKMIDLSIDDYLNINGDYVKITGLTKHTGEDQVFYDVNGVLVTGHHYIRHNNHWIHVLEHPNAIKTDIIEEFVYCLTTKEKIIQINDELFLDWDDFDEKAEKKSKIKKHDVDYFTSYLDSNTLIKMNNQKYKKLKDINIGDTLYGNISVLGKIHLGDKQLYCYNFKNKIIKSSRNLIYYENNKKQTTLDKNICESPFIGSCMQLFTENKRIPLINNIIIGDYDTSLENLIY